MMIQYSFPRSVLQILVAMVMLLAGAWAASMLHSQGRESGPAAMQDAGQVNQPPAGHTRIVVLGVKHGYGKIVLFGFNDADAWNNQDFDAATSYLVADAAPGRMVLDIAVADGAPRAWSLFHDENSDGDLNIEAGYPLEAFGSSGANSALDEPDFGQASTQDSVVTIKLFYPY